MSLKGKKCLKSDIWPEATNQAKGTKNIMRKVWAIKAHYWQKASMIYSILLFLKSKKARYVNQLTSYTITIVY